MRREEVVLGNDNPVLSFDRSKPRLLQPNQTDADWLCDNTIAGTGRVGRNKGQIDGGSIFIILQESNHLAQLALLGKLSGTVAKEIAPCATPRGVHGPPEARTRGPARHQP